MIEDKSQNSSKEKNKTSITKKLKIRFRNENKSRNLSLVFIILISNIITIKRNSTTIAPTYTIKNNNAKYSKHNKNNNVLPKKKTIIKIKIECIGFCTPITKVDAPNKNAIIIDINEFIAILIILF